MIKPETVAVSEGDRRTWLLAAMARSTLTVHPSSRWGNGFHLLCITYRTNTDFSYTFLEGKGDVSIWHQPSI